MTSKITTFPNTENPISEGGDWGNAASGTWTNPVTCTAGTPGTAQGPGSSGINDAISVLQNGSWGRAHDVSVTAKITGTPTGNPEIEPNLHGSQNATQTFGYEGDTIWNSNKWDCVIARWDGNQGNVTVIGSGSFLTPPVDGDIIRHFDDGTGVMTMTVNGNIVATTAADTTYTGGRPWLGFDVGAGSGVVIKGYSATDGVGIASSGAYQQEQSTTDRYLLEDGSGVYLIEPWPPVAGGILPPWCYGNIDGIGSPGRFFKDRLG